MKTKKYFYRKILISTICTGSIIIYFLSTSKILGATPSGDSSYLYMEGMNQNVEQGQVVNDIEQEGSYITDDVYDELQNEALAAEEEVGTNEEITEDVYVVKEGQTLWEISQETEIPIQDLIEQNGLGNIVITEGQELDIN